MINPKVVDSLAATSNDFFLLNIVDRWIVTAAHCLASVDEVYASFGINSDGDFMIEKQLIESVHRFPEFVNNDVSGHDIG